MESKSGDSRLDSSENLIYRTSKRRITSLVNDFFLSSFFLFICSLMVMSDEYYIKIIAITLSGLFLIPLFFNVILFDEIIIYKDKVVICWLIFGKFSVKMDDIKQTDLSTSTLLRVLRIVHRKKYFFKFYFFVSGLVHDIEVKDIIDTIKKGN